MSRSTLSNRLARTTAVSTALAVALLGGGAASAFAAEAPVAGDAVTPVTDVPAPDPQVAPSSDVPALSPEAAPVAPTAPAAESAPEQATGTPPEELPARAEQPAAAEVVPVAPITVDAPTGTINTRTTFSGSGEPGADVVAYLTTTAGAPVGQPVATGQVGADGRWSLSATLPGGPQTVHFEQWAPDGSVTTASVAVRALSLSVDPLTGPTTDHPTLTGDGVPGAPVAVYLTTADGRPIGTPVGTATVGPDGRWSLVASLPGGPQTIVASTTWAGDYVEVAVDVVVAPTPFSADTPARVVPRHTTVTGSGQPGLTVRAWRTGTSGTTAVGLALASTTVDESGRWTLDLTLDPGTHHLYLGESTGQGDDAAEIASEVETLQVGEFDVTTPSGTVPATSTVEGAGLPGATVTYWATTPRGTAVGTPLGTTVVGPDGTWSVEVTLPAGTHSLWFGQSEGPDGTDLEVAHEVIALTVLAVTDPTDPTDPAGPTGPAATVSPTGTADPSLPNGSARLTAHSPGAFEQTAGTPQAAGALAHTGSTAGPLGALALLLGAAGASLLTVVRRRTSKG